jgi:hypothetical protein
MSERGECTDYGQSGRVNKTYKGAGAESRTLDGSISPCRSIDKHVDVGLPMSISVCPCRSIDKHVDVDGTSFAQIWCVQGV